MDTVTTFDLVRMVGGWPVDLTAVGVTLERMRVFLGLAEGEAVPMGRSWTEAELVAAGLLPASDGR